MFFVRVRLLYFRWTPRFFFFFSFSFFTVVSPLADSFFYLFAFGIVNAAFGQMDTSALLNVWFLGMRSDFQLCLFRLEL